jgi:hypothetical protein
MIGADLSTMDVLGSLEYTSPTGRLLKYFDEEVLRKLGWRYATLVDVDKIYSRSSWTSPPGESGLVMI